MAIADLRVVQSKETKYLSDFTVILEKIRVAGEATVSPGQLGGRLQNQSGEGTPTVSAAGQFPLKTSAAETAFSSFGNTSPVTPFTP
jgi:hypothetical protein